MRRSPLRYSVLLAALLAWCGCEHDCYEIKIKPDGEAFQRRLACWHVGGKNNETIRPLNATKLASLARLYPRRETPDNAKKQVFAGQFTGKTPNDVGGAGTYTCYATPLGSTSAYVERFRGDDDLEPQLDKQLAKRQKAADQLADLLAGWMDAELGREPNFPKLKKFLDKDLRRDLRNLAAYSLASELCGESQTPPSREFLVRIGQYFYERGYFSPQEIPTLLRALCDDPKPLFVCIQRFLARKMGIADDQPLPASFGFLDTPERLIASCEKYVRSTELFRKRHDASNLQKKDKDRITDPPEESPQDEGILLVSELAYGVMGFYLNFNDYDSLCVKLFSGEKPYVTNGKWDEKTAAVTWDSGVSNDAEDHLLPVVCFALWSTPDGEFQKMHFGKILLTGSDLAEYAFWYRSLKPEEAKEWDRFLDGLKPGPDLAAGVKAFRFSSDPKADPNKPDEQRPASLADMPRRLILNDLEVKPGGTQ